MYLNSTKKNILFIGNFNISFSSNSANSPAANQVQIEIFHKISKIFENYNVIASVNKPLRTWPFSKLIQRGEIVGNYRFVGFLNFLFFRDFIVYLKHFHFATLIKPAIIFKYNVSFFESLFLFVLKFFFQIKIVVFIQDIYSHQNNSNWFFKKLEFLALKMCNKFDVIVPISNAIVNDFNLDVKKTFVFQGGMTQHSKELISRDVNFDEVSKSNYILFAGALEEYNGIKKIVDFWLYNKPEYELHIYGKGSLENYIKNSETVCDKIKYLGFATESVIIEAELHSYGNFCIRNSSGIKESYFFPSKFFNVLASPGKVFINEFENLPHQVKAYCFVLDDDLKNLGNYFNSFDNKLDFENFNQRKKWLSKYADWSFAITSIREILEKK